MDITYRVPAQVQALVLPIGNIRRSTFDQYYERLISANEVRLVDLSPAQQADHSYFHPQNYPNGRVLYNFTRVPTPASSESLFDVEIWRANLLVLAIAHYSDLETLESALNDMRQTYKSLSSCQILVFGFPEDVKTEPKPYILPVLSSNYTSLETALCDVTSNLFNSLNALVISKQLGSFKSPSFKALDLADNSTLTVQKSTGRRNRHMPWPSSVSINRSGSISMNVTERAKNRQKGRSLKFMGSLYLLTGRLPSALDSFAEAATVLKNSHDHLWFASCLDSIGVCLVLQAFYNLPVTIPTIAINTVEGETESFVTRHSKSSQQQKLSSFLPSLIHTVLRFFDRCNPESEESVPKILYQETILRYTTLLSLLRRGGGWNGASLSAVIRGTDVKLNILEESPSVTEIEEWCQLVFQTPTFNINTLSDWNAMQTLLSIYANAGLERKWAFAVQQLVMSLATQGESEIIKNTPQESIEALFHQLSNFYGSSRMKVTCIRAFLNLATRMGSYKFVAYASGLMLKIGPEILTKDEQLSLNQVLRDDGEINHEFSNPSLLQDIKLIPVHVTKQRQTAPSSTGEPGSHGAIIYNPFEHETEQGFLIQNDPTPVKVYLNNPFAFELHISEIYIVDKDDKCISRSSKDVVLPPQTTFCVIIDLVPPSPGPLEISGCWIQMSGCVPQVFKLGAKNEQGASSAAPINIDVLTARPCLAVRKTSFENNWAMLLEGESTNFTVEISNTSTTPSQPLEFGFSDSTIDPLRQAIAKPEATRAEIYELEHFLHERKAVEMISKTSAIPAHESRAFNFQLNGKRGVSSATILVDSGSDQSTRIRIPLNATVYPSIELDGIEITQLFKDSAMNGDLMVLLSLRNSWREALDVSVWSNANDRQTVRVESMHTHRFIMSIDWPYIPQEELLKPIPSLLNKQYVVDTKTTPEMLRNFWLREKLLGNLKGEWATVDNHEKRHGEIEMRGIQLNRKLVNVLNTQSIDLSMKIASVNVEVDEVFEISTRAVNRSHRERAGMLRIVPDDPNKCIVVGNLQRPVVIPANGEITITTKVIPLCAGRVEWYSLIDLVGDSAPCFQRIPLVLDARG